jgi:hypothetical protein
MIMVMAPHKNAKSVRTTRQAAPTPGPIVG